jgi:hypothetical protein
VSPQAGVIPAGECAPLELSLDAMGLMEDDYEALLTINTNDPFNELIEVPVLLHVAEVDLAYIDVDPNTLNLSSNGRTVRAALQLPPMYDPYDIVIESVSIGGVLFAEPAPISYEDSNGDGVLELIVKFDRAAFEALVPEGDSVPVTVTGEVRDTVWFTGTDYIRTIRPRVLAPNGAEYLVAGETVEIRWTEAPLPVDAYTVWLSRDGGASWEQLASGLGGTSYDWVVDGALTEEALVRVYALDQHGVMGYDTSDATFVVAGALHPPSPVSELLVGHDDAALLLEWKRPIVDLLHGPASHYRVLRATSPQGPWSEIAAPTAETTSDTLEVLPGQSFFYRIVATNAAGDAAP